MTFWTLVAAEFGSVSSGTMRTEDLLTAFTDTLDHLLSIQPRRFPRKKYRALIRDANKALALEDSDTAADDASDIVSELFDALNEFAPVYGYFGAHCGDGADYGYWLVDDLEECFDDGLKVSDTSEVPADYRGEVLHVNERGNVTLYVAHGRKGRAPKLREIWSLV